MKKKKKPTRQAIHTSPLELVQTALDLVAEGIHPEQKCLVAIINEEGFSDTWEIE